MKVSLKITEGVLLLYSLLDIRLMDRLQAYIRLIVRRQQFLLHFQRHPNPPSNSICFPTLNWLQEIHVPINWIVR
jgi:hypothetical protein